MATRALDSKFACDGERVFNMRNGHDVPRDEPMFLLRARDIHALGTLLYYERLCAAGSCDHNHMQGLAAIVSAFRQFAREHPDRMKDPGSSLRKAGER
jgi:hypothetical protein